jgi:hypothetical protein
MRWRKYIYSEALEYQREVKSRLSAKNHTYSNPFFLLSTSRFLKVAKMLLFAKRVLLVFFGGVEIRVLRF